MSFQYITPKYNDGQVNVVAFGADPTGVADSTVAFQNAMAAGPCFVPAFQSDGTTRAVYKISNVVVPNGAALIGVTPRGYVGGSLDSGQYMRPLLNVSSGKAFIVDSKQGMLFQGLNMSGPGAGGTTDCITPGGASLYIKDCLITGFRNGVGGGSAIAGSTATNPTYSWELHMTNTLVQSCNTGIGNIIDSWIEGCSITSNINGFSGIMIKSMITDTRIEWNGQPFTGGTGSGVIVQGNGACFNNVQFDANGNTGIAMTGSDISISGCLFTQNGSNVSSGTTLITTSAHMQFNGVSRVTITGCTSYLDNQTGVWSPAHFASFTGTNNGIIFTANNMSGYQGSTAGASKLGPISSNTTWLVGTPPSGSGGLNGYLLTHNMGTGTAAQDVDTR